MKTNKERAREETQKGSEALQLFSEADLAAWGLSFLAYVKPVEMEGARFYAIHAANGAHLGLARDRAVAFALARQNDLEPVSVH